MAKIEIVTIGDELLIGQVIDTNSAWMGKQLNDAGFEVARVNSISDSEEEILNILKETSERSDVVLITGGLGPTKDDITKTTLCRYFNTELVFNEEVFEDVKSLLKRYVPNINELNRQQAMVPANCSVIRNPVGTAPIMWFEHKETIFVSMPGVPSEMKRALEFEIIPRLVSRFVTSSIIHKTVIVSNIPEATLADMLSDFEKEIPTHIKLAYLPSPGRIRLRFTGRGESEKVVAAEIEQLITNLEPIIGDAILGYDDKPTVQFIADIFKENNLSLGTAESCTGGNIAHQITLLPGSSNYFKGGVVAYHNDVKMGMLAVKEETLNKVGAVSKEVVEQMAIGARYNLGVDYSVTTSGIAGPDGGTDEKPIGTIWIAVGGPNGINSKKFNFGHIRERNIVRSTEMALVMLKKMVEQDLTK
ncbi:CinA family nicotinamide mononucleotide deamidase-related protein [Labilibacter marinus]|uniref:CinA family nicotinamide mononucleotide deamidase-related protein n=1 Tax=Labilibacter marinus TaxID=1477105 RepID=UPI00094FF891|nr:CinA family nicotinamide mononucleotide deamidase-related protein [Labilibacter marinus]